MSLVKFNSKARHTAPYFNNVFDSLFTDALQKNYGVSKQPSVNIHETDLAFHIELAAPGLSKNDFKIEVKKDNLSIWAEKKVDEGALQKDYSRKEFEYTSFARSFALPEGVDSEQINANYEGGILYVTIAKATVKNDVKEIVVS